MVRGLDVVHSVSYHVLPNPPLSHRNSDIPAARCVVGRIGCVQEIGGRCGEVTARGWNNASWATGGGWFTPAVVPHSPQDGWVGLNRRERCAGVFHIESGFRRRGANEGVFQC